MEKNFGEICRLIPSIRVYNPKSDSKNDEITILYPYYNDEEHYDRRIGEYFLEGNGSKENPFRYSSSCDVSPHYSIIDLWFRFKGFKDAFIEVNDWLLKVRSDGVVGEDGHITKFI